MIVSLVGEQGVGYRWMEVEEHIALTPFWERASPVVGTNTESLTELLTMWSGGGSCPGLPSPSQRGRGHEGVLFVVIWSCHTPRSGWGLRKEGWLKVKERGGERKTVSDRGPVS